MNYSVRETFFNSIGHSVLNLENIFHRTEIISVWPGKKLKNFQKGYLNINLFFSFIFFDKFLSFIFFDKFPINIFIQKPLI